MRWSDDKASSISTKSIREYVQILRVQSLRSSTRRNYYNIWRIFNAFFLQLDCKPKTWEDKIVLFVAYLIDKKIKSNTINCYVSAIKKILKEDGVKIQEDRSLLNSLTRACKLKNDKATIRLPIHKSLLREIVSAIIEIFDQQPFVCNLYQTMFISAFFGLLRIGEIMKSPHVIKVRDIHIEQNKCKLMFLFRSSKTYGLDAKPQIIKLSKESHKKDNKLLWPIQGPTCIH